MSQPLAQQATGKIIEMVLSGTLVPGDGLQEAKLGEMLDMSRTPVRKAIKWIEAEGLAVQDGRFLKVRTLTAAEVEEIFFSCAACWRPTGPGRGLRFPSPCSTSSRRGSVACSSTVRVPACRTASSKAVRSTWKCSTPARRRRRQGGRADGRAHNPAARRHSEAAGSIA
jgi:hypothetical protein